MRSRSQLCNGGQERPTHGISEYDCGLIGWLWLKVAPYGRAEGMKIAIPPYLQPTHLYQSWAHHSCTYEWHSHIHFAPQSPPTVSHFLSVEMYGNQGEDIKIVIWHGKYFVLYERVLITAVNQQCNASPRIHVFVDRRYNKAHLFVKVTVEHHLHLSKPLRGGYFHVIGYHINVCVWTVMCNS